MLKYKCQLLKGDPVYGEKLADVFLWSVNFETNTIDITNKNNNGYKEIITGVTILISITGSFKDKASREIILSYANKKDKNIFSIIGVMDTYQKLFIRDLEYDLYNNTFSATLCSEKKN